MGRKLTTAFVSLAILGASAGGVWALHATKPAPEVNDDGPRPISIFVDEVRRENFKLSIKTQGEVRPRTEIDVIAQVSGRIEWVAANLLPGAAVSAGGVLLRIEPADYELAVVRAESRIAEAETRIQLREADAEIARRNWDNSIIGEPTPLALKIPQLEEARAMLRSAEADLEAARLNLRRTSVSVPFEGRVREKKADIGQFVSAGTPLARVYSTELVEIRLPLTDAQLAEMGLPIGYDGSAFDGPTVDLSATVAGAVRHWQGRIVRVEAAADPETRVYYSVAEVRDPYGVGADNGMPLAVGLFVTAEIGGIEIANANVIPRTALRSGNKVFVVTADNTLDIREVEIVYSDAESVIISKGVEVGEQVVISAIRAPRQGMALVRIGDDKQPPLTSSADQ